MLADLDPSIIISELLFAVMMVAFGSLCDRLRRPVRPSPEVRPAKRTRTVVDTGGMYEIQPPWSGFGATTDRVLAEAVAARLDEVDPLPTAGLSQVRQ